MLRSWLCVAFLLAATCCLCSGFVSPAALLPHSHQRNSCSVGGLRRGMGPPPLRVSMQVGRGDKAQSWNKYVKEGMVQPVTSKRQPEGPLEDDPTLPMIEEIVLACDERKAEDIWAARVAHLTYTTSFFVNVVGTSRPMLQAIASNVENIMLEKYGREIKWQGNPDSGWILLDYGECIVNIMTPAAREFYDLESMWKNGETVPLGHLIKPNAGVVADVLIEDDDWGSADPFDKWNTWDEAADLTPAEKAMMDKEGREDPGDDE